MASESKENPAAEGLGDEEYGLDIAGASDAPVTGHKRGRKAHTESQKFENLVRRNPCVLNTSHALGRWLSEKKVYCVPCATWLDLSSNSGNFSGHTDSGKHKTALKAWSTVPSAEAAGCSRCIRHRTIHFAYNDGGTRP